MARRYETEAERSARERVKAGFDSQMAAVNDFFRRERRIETIRVEIASLEAEQADAVGRLVASTSVAHAAKVVGWTQSRVRDATCRAKRSAPLIEATGRSSAEANE